jgi:glyoxylase-like metal-dependent hydrolase (beta-lactamase superfamily II)
MERENTMSDWFTIDRVDADTYIISEYRHWEETHCYLLNGSKRSLLIDTGLGICNISEEIEKLTDKPVTVIATHIHWDHIGGHKYYPDFYAHEAELDWLSSGFPLTMDTIRNMVVDRCDLPNGYNVNVYEFFQGTPTRILHDGDVIDIGGRVIEVLHTPGHSPGHMCFWDKECGYLFTGDLVYKDTLFAYYPSTDPSAYLESLEKISISPVKRVFPAHHSLDIQPEILIRMRDAFRKLKADGKLHHGSGTFDYGDWAVWL